MRYHNRDTTSCQQLRYSEQHTLVRDILPIDEVDLCDHESWRNVKFDLSEQRPVHFGYIVRYSERSARLQIKNTMMIERSLVRVIRSQWQVPSGSENHALCTDSKINAATAGSAIGRQHQKSQFIKRTLPNRIVQMLMSVLLISSFFSIFHNGYVKQPSR
jgi:hypothetical protein